MITQSSILVRSNSIYLQGGIRCTNTATKKSGFGNNSTHPFSKSISTARLPTRTVHPTKSLAWPTLLSTDWQQNWSRQSLKNTQNAIITADEPFHPVRHLSRANPSDVFEYGSDFLSCTHIFCYPLPLVSYCFSEQTTLSLVVRTPVHRSYIHTNSLPPPQLKSIPPKTNCLPTSLTSPTGQVSPTTLSTPSRNPTPASFDRCLPPYRPPLTPVPETYLARATRQPAKCLCHNLFLHCAAMCLSTVPTGFVMIDVIRV